MRILAAIFSVICSVSAPGEQAQPAFKYGERPASPVFDPTGFLTQGEREKVSGPLMEILENERIEIIVVILPEIGEAPPDHVMKSFAEAWATQPINAVVLHVPGMEGSPWISPGEVITGVIKPEAISETISEAQKRAAAESTDFGKVRAASTEAADAIRYWLGGVLLRAEGMVNERLEQQLARERRERLLMVSAVLGAVALASLALGAVFIAIQIRRRTSRRFPQIRKIPRLGAPHAGGGSICSKPIR